MFSESYSNRQIFHNGHLDTAIENQKIIKNNEIVFMKKKALANGHKSEIIYKNPDYFRKTQKKVHFSPYSILVNKPMVYRQGMPNLPIDSLILYRKKINKKVKSKKNRKGSQKKRKDKTKTKRKNHIK